MTVMRAAPRAALVVIAALLLLLATSGCTENSRVAQVAAQAADRQAAQNVALARVANAAARGANDLVAADAAARRDAVELHAALQAERARLDEGWRELHAAHQTHMAERSAASTTQTSVQALGVALVAVLALSLAWLVLARSRDSEPELCQLALDLLDAERLGPDPGTLLSPPPPVSKETS